MERLFENSPKHWSLRPIREGVGAGYDFKIYGLELRNVRIGEISTGRYGEQTAEFKADVVPGKYDWSCMHSYWSLSSEDRSTFPVRQIKVSGTVEGMVDNYGGIPWTGEDFVAEVEGESNGHGFDLQALIGPGWVHRSVPERLDIETNDTDFIDASSDRSGYKNAYIYKASLRLPAEYINSCIEDAMDFSDEDSDYEDGEDFEEKTARLRVKESIKGNTERFLKNLEEVLDGYLETEQDWLDMESTVMYLKKHEKTLTAALRAYISGGCFGIYDEDILEDLAYAYENTPEEKKAFGKMSSEKLWNRYVEVLTIYIPRIFKRKFKRPFGEPEAAEKSPKLKEYSVDDCKDDIEEESVESAKLADYASKVGNDALANSANGRVAAFGDAKELVGRIDTVYEDKSAEILGK